MEQIDKLKKILNTPSNFVLTSHRNPDGDAIGSSLGFYHYLKNLGHQVTMIMPSEYPPAFFWMDSVGEVMIYDLAPKECNEAIDHADYLFALDYNSLDRVDSLGEYMRSSEKNIIVIDHHLYPDDFYLTFLDTTASSTSELIYRLIADLEDKGKITPNIAECLYTGILTDTGSFSYSTSPRLYRIVADIIDRGIDTADIHDKVNNSFDVKQIRLLGHCLINRMEVLEEFGAAIINLNKRDFEVFNIQRGDTEGIVNYMLKMKKVNVAFFVTEQMNIIKISIRSKGDLNVQEVASKYFNGGGHKNASGGYQHTSLNAVLLKIKSILPNIVKQSHIKN